METIGILYPGAMGSSLARTLSSRLPHLTLLTSLSNRSASTVSRAESSGLTNVPLSELVSRSDIILSILPPSSATDLAKEIISHLPSNRSKPLIYADLNAVSPGTTSKISALLLEHDIVFLDGSVLGLPATETFDPKIYLSCRAEFESSLNEVADVLSGGSPGKGLAIHTMPGAGEGAASALKMCYGGINKGYVGLASLLVMAANAHSKGTADALLDEFADSKTAALEGFSRSFPDMIGKAYRWVGEMEEISSFINTSLSGNDSSDLARENARKVAETFQGLAKVFQRVADDVRDDEEEEQGDSAGKEEVDKLLDWGKRGGEAVKRKKQGI
ncbi:hypothetical protein BCR39DRAFT_523044 [Naematelia encephala]|uniref:Uncharacterized protein n=1 Tax=Naematelia encephala TaxID=71784 RepID=A0A1Y2BCM8_9TREE|nr:hypothetical protein BCR39DRAFT_523044 [Naematelia encephala]